MAQTKIAGLFLDPTVVSGLTAITDGDPDADYLFVWDAGTSTLKKIYPDNLGLAVAVHTVVSHDTTITGAELTQLSGISANVTDTNLNALTAGSGDTTLHSHAGAANS